MVIALILAGGVGSRVGADCPKQFVNILGKPILAYTIEIYQKHLEVDAIEIVCHKEWKDYLTELIRKYNLTKVRWVVDGGSTFQESVINGVANLKKEIDSEDIVMIHYGAAPFTSPIIITDAIKVCRQHNMSVSCTPCYQLIGSNDEGNISKNWIDRDKLTQIACPQSFKFGYLLDVYKRAEEQELLERIEPHTTSLIYELGDVLYKSYGDQTNIKITTKEDLDMFEGYVLMKKRRESIAVMNEQCREKNIKQGISRKQFDILELLITEKKFLSEKEIGQRLGMSLEAVNDVVKELNQLGYVEDGLATEDGINLMEAYRVKRAIFLAAGFGSRLAPITLNTPKPLVRVKGKRIIDGLIEACISIGINDIYIIRGYLAEQFDQLLYKYPMIKFIENPVYDETNNISSAMCARYMLSNAYVFEADLLISNAKIIKPYHYTSDFLAIKKDKTHDWCFTVKDGIIIDEKMGGTDCWQMVGISYWSEIDGNKLSSDIAVAYESQEGKQKYWEQVPLVLCREHYQVEVCECYDEDITEIDTVQELKELDSIYDA